MCEKAEEIQKLWKYKMGDWFFQDTKVDILEQNFQDDYKGDEWKTRKVRIFGSGENKAIWLPTQEQLWNMLPEIKNKVHVVFRFNKFLSGKYINDSAHVAFLVLSNMPKEDEEDFSISELLFCFVMKELYNKIWTGKDWENSK